MRNSGASSLSSSFLLLPLHTTGGARREGPADPPAQAVPEVSTAVTQKPQPKRPDGAAPPAPQRTRLPAPPPQPAQKQLHEELLNPVLGKNLEGQRKKQLLDELLN